MAWSKRLATTCACDRRGTALGIIDILSAVGVISLTIAVVAVVQVILSVLTVEDWLVIAAVALAVAVVCL
jgi:hypothetical protein